MSSLCPRSEAAMRQRSESTPPGRREERGGAEVEHVVPVPAQRGSDAPTLRINAAWQEKEDKVRGVAQRLGLATIRPGLTCQCILLHKSIPCPTPPQTPLSRKIPALHPHPAQPPVLAPMQMHSQSPPQSKRPTLFLVPPIEVPSGSRCTTACRCVRGRGWLPQHHLASVAARGKLLTCTMIDEREGKEGLYV